MKLRARVLAEHPVCHVCHRKPSVNVDHIKPVSKGGDDRSDNLQGICFECHEEKTRKDFGLKKKKNRVGIDGYPIIEKEEYGETRAITKAKAS